MIAADESAATGNSIEGQTPAEVNRATVEQGIAAVSTSIETGLSESVLQALAALSVDTASRGFYVEALTRFTAANKALVRRDIQQAVSLVVTDKPVGGEKLRPDENDELASGIEPADEPQDGAELLAELQALVNRYCVLPAESAASVALWVLAAYCIEAFRIFPKLLVSSPQKRCGKTTLLEILQAVMPRALTGSNMSPAVIFRAIEAWQCSLLIDEADTFLHGNDELRGIINSGHTRSAAYVLRVEGDKVLEPKRFSTWAPMVLAMIGSPPGTIQDRSIEIRLQRKTLADRVERLPLSLINDTATLRTRCQRWSIDSAIDLRQAEPDVPELSNDRAMNNWTPILAVAELSGGDWPEHARRAMRVLEASQGIDDDDLSIELLKDIRDVFANDPSTLRIFSDELTETLVGMSDRPWPELQNGRPMSPNKLARLLRPYGIRPSEIRIGSGKRKGYKADAFADVFSRYLPIEQNAEDTADTPLFNRDTATTAPDQRFSENTTATKSEPVAVAEPLKAAETLACRGVSVADPPAESVEVKRRGIAI